MHSIDEIGEASTELVKLVVDIGLDELELSRVARLISKVATIDESIAQRLIRGALIPRGSVSSSAVISLLGPFTSFSLRLKSTVAKWIVLLFELIQPRKHLHQLYQVFFQHLDYESLRPWLVNILYRLTRREDVRPSRVEYLYKLHQDVGDEPELFALLGLYREYYPDMILPAPIKLSKISPFKCPDWQWFREIQVLQMKRREIGLSDRPLDSVAQLGPQKAIESNWKRKIDELGTFHSSLESLEVYLRRQLGNQEEPDGKRQRIELTVDQLGTVPAPKTIPMFLDSHELAEDAIWIEQIQSFEDFIQHFEEIALPNRVSAALNNRFLAHFLDLDASGDILHRLDQWLQFELLHRFRWSDRTEPKVLERRKVLLDVVVSFALFVNETIPSAQQFLFESLKTWDGNEHFEQYMVLLGLLPPLPYQEFFDNVLTPFNNLIFTIDTLSQSRIVHALTELLRRWASIDWSVAYSGSTMPWLFATVDASIDYFSAIRNLVKYVDQLGVLLLQSSADDLIIAESVLEFFESASTLCSKFELPFVVVPSDFLVYRLLLSNAAVCVSRGCGILVSYKSELDALETGMPSFELGSESLIVFNGRQYPKLSFEDGASSMENLNSFIITFVNTLWRGHLSNPQSALNLPREMLEQMGLDLSSDVLSFKSSSAFIPLVHAYNIEHGAESSSDLIHIRKGEEPEFVTWLESIGFSGLVDFMRAFVKALQPSHPESF